MLQIDPSEEDEWLKRRQKLVENFHMRPHPSVFLSKLVKAGPSMMPGGHSGPDGGVLGGKATPHSDQGGHREMKQRFLKLAGGASPVVIKVIGFSAGAGTNRLVSYIAREGKTPIENELGERLDGTAIPHQVAKAWSELVVQRSHTADLATFTLEAVSRSRCRAGLADELTREAFGDRAFAFATVQGLNALQINGIVVLNSWSEGRLPPDEMNANAIRNRLTKAIGDDTIDLGFHFDRHGHGTRWAAAALRNLVARFPDGVRDNRNESIDTKDTANKLVQRSWRRLMGSRAPRDTLHIVILAGKDADHAKFERSLRHFLSQEFKGHRYVFAIHNPERDPKPQAEGGKRPHLHAHAIIATRSDFGDRLNVWVTDLTRWRETFGQSARAYDMNVERISREETASSRAYTHRQVRPVSFEGRTEHEGTSPAAQRRYEAKRSDQPVAATTRAGKAQAKIARQTWEELTRPNYSDAVRTYAQRMLARFDEADRLANRDVAEASSVPIATAGRPPGQVRTVLRSNDTRLPKSEERPPGSQTPPNAVTPDKVSIAADQSQRLTSRPSPSLGVENGDNHAAVVKNEPSGLEAEASGGFVSMGSALVAALKQARAAARAPKRDAFDINVERMRIKQRMQVQNLKNGSITRELLAAAQAKAQEGERPAERFDRADHSEPPKAPERLRPDTEITRRPPQEDARPQRSIDRSRSAGRDDYER